MIVLQFDDRYQPWGSLLLRSLARHEPETAVLVDTVNLYEAQEGELRATHPGAEVRVRRIDPPPTPWEMANRKPFVLREAIERHPGAAWYAMLDADMLVRRPLTALWGLLERAPVALIQTDGTYDGRFAAGQIFNSSIVELRRDGLELVEGWCRWSRHDGPLGGIEPGRWFWDQLTLLMAWCDNPQLASAAIPWPLYADWRLSPAATIWSAHVPAGWKDRYRARYRQELDRMEPATDPGR